MKKKILFDKNLEEKLKVGVSTVSDVVSKTFGPAGGFVGIENQYGIPTITKDGVTAAKSVDLEDPYENMGARLLIEISSKTNEEAGDGTTTSAILGGSMILSGLDKKAEIGVRNPIEIKRGMDKAAKICDDWLKENAISIDTKEQIEAVATISANNDEVIGKLVADAFEKVGKDGIVNVEETRSMETEISVSEGMEIDGGYASPYFVTNRERLSAEFEDALILLTDKKIVVAEDVINYVEEAASKAKPLLIVCDDLVEGEAMQLLFLNIMRGTLKVAVVKNPSFGQKKKDLLEDIAALTGATVVSEDAGFSLADGGPNLLGTAKSIKVTSNKTVIVGGGADKKYIEQYTETLKKQIEEVESPKDKETLKKRIAKFNGSAATISVGGATETEIRELKYRIEDAICATKAALEEGIVAGGGTTLLKLACVISDKNNEFTTKGEQIGQEIFMASLEVPFSKIVENLICDGETKLLSCLDRYKYDLASKDAKLSNYGFNAKTGEYEEDMVAAGIIDPVKVTRAAIRNANSVAGILLATDCAIVNAPSKEECECKN